MKSLKHLLFAGLIMLFAFSGLAQNKKSRYDEFILGYTAFHTQQFDSAFNIFSRFTKKPMNDDQTAWAFIYIGQIEWQRGNLYTAQGNLLQAISTLDSMKESARGEVPGYAYNLLGNINVDLGLYDDAIRFYDDATPFFKGTDYAIEVLNGKAIAFQKKKDYGNAIAVYNSILSSNPKDQLLVARIIDNRARTKWLKDTAYSPLKEYYAAANIRLDSNFYAGLTASYGHLSDYYANKNPDSAYWYAYKMYAAGIACENADDIVDALDKLAINSNLPDTIKKWHAAFKKMNDSLEFARDTIQNRFEFSKYDANNSKLDNLVLQATVSTQRAWLFRLSIVALAVTTTLSIWYDQRKKRLKRESENAIRESKLKTSQRVHDVVANGLYVIMNELEHKNDLEREPLITRIEDLYEQSRDISYEEISNDGNADYYAKSHDLFNGFMNEQTDVFVVGNQHTFWDKLSDSQKYELYMALKNIMINMKRHSEAKNVIVQFKQENNRAIIVYKDDGIGLNNDKFGNGLNNTVSRIKSLNGDINFGKSEKGGTLIEINFPFEPSKI